jgi:hypothetical protein
MSSNFSADNMLFRSLDILGSRINLIIDLSKFMITANLTILGINIALGKNIFSAGSWMMVLPSSLYASIIVMSLIITIPRTKQIDKVDRKSLSSLISVRTKFYYFVLFLYALATAVFIYTLHQIAFLGGSE